MQIKSLFFLPKKKKKRKVLSEESQDRPTIGLCDRSTECILLLAWFYNVDLAIKKNNHMRILAQEEILFDSRLIQINFSFFSQSFKMEV